WTGDCPLSCWVRSAVGRGLSPVLLGQVRGGQGTVPCPRGPDRPAWAMPGSTPAPTMAESPGRNAKGGRMTMKHPKGPAERAGDPSVAPVFTLEGGNLPRHELPADELPPEVAYQIVHDELMLDGNARLNLATFVSTWMEPQVERLMAECFDKNMIDKDEYPQTAAIEVRCVNILSSLWNAPGGSGDAVGCSTTGSSEAAVRGGLAPKRRGQRRRPAEGKPVDKPNLVMGINVQVCWEKLANYWDVEMRLVPMEGDRYHLGA